MKRRDIGITLNKYQVDLAVAYAGLISDHRRTFEARGARVVDKSIEPEAVEILGYLGEMAVCAYTCWQPNWYFVPTYDEGRDFIKNDISMQVKTGRSQMARNLMFKDTNDFKLHVDAAIFVQYAGQNVHEPWKDPFFVICGYIPRVEFMKNHKTRDFGQGVGPQPCMDKDDLLCFDDLVALVRQKGDLDD